MDATPGDELVIDGNDGGRDQRVGLILSTSQIDGHVAYLVHWIVGDYDSMVSPWPAVHVRHRTDHSRAA
jgi:Domain of unknown function (DUF1918)